MKADHPAERLRVKVVARGIAACSGSVSAPRGRRFNATLKADHPARGRASAGERSSSTTWPQGAVSSRCRR
eukprot:4049754-Prymnesium_polylepis.1